MSVQNEKLIEEAAKAIFAEEQCDRHQRRDAESVTENWETRLADADQSEYRSFARAALAVFEKALTPTDDEREALSQIIKDVSANTPGDLIPQFRRDLIVSKILAAGFRRSEVPETAPELFSGTLDALDSLTIRKEEA